MSRRQTASTTRSGGSFELLADDLGDCGLVLVVPSPPLVGRGLRVPGRRILPVLFAAQRRQVEECPGGAKGLDPATGREVSGADLVGVAKKNTQAESLALVRGEARGIRLTASRRRQGRT